MSIINDALKKAQKQRADELAAPPPKELKPTPTVPPMARLTPPIPPAPAPSAVRYTPAAVAKPKPKSPTSHRSSVLLLWISLGAIAIIAISVRLTVMFTKPSAEPLATSKPQPVAKTPSASAPAPQVEPSFPAPTLAVPSVTLPNREPEPTQITSTEPAPTAAPAPAPIIEFKPAAPTPPPTVAKTETPAVRPLPVAVPVASAATPPAAVPAPTPTPAAALPPLYAPRPPTTVNPSIRIQNFIDRLRVSGIRMSDRGSKVILNDRLFTAGELVDTGLELKLIKIEQGVLTFADSNGKKYIKLFQ